MKKTFLAAICAIFAFTATAQKTGFTMQGPVTSTAKKIGLEITYPESIKWPNGGKTVELTLRLDTTNQEYHDEVIMTGKVKLDGQSDSTGYSLHVPSITNNGTVTVSGANLISATGNTITVTRWLNKEEAKGMPLKTVYTITEGKLTRESTYDTGVPVLELVLP